MNRVISGIKPTSEPHLGNYLGAMRRWVQEQADAETLFFIADLHAITLPQDPQVLRERTLKLAHGFLAIGLDPEVTTIFVQSHVPEHAQLDWLLECTARFGELRRMTQFKDKAGTADMTGEGEGVTAGFFTYPCLMAADILLYDVNEVPVGDDQRQHLELTRDIAIRFNSAYGNTFTVPKATLPKVGARVRDLQEPANKMSKSSDSPGTIWLFDDFTTIEKKIKRAVTDTGSDVVYDPVNKPGVSNLLEILGSVTNQDPATLAQSYTQYGPLKADTAQAVVELLRPLHKRYQELQADPQVTLDALSNGAARAREIAGPTLERAQKNIGFLPIN